LYKRDEVEYRKVVEKEIMRKEAKKSEAPTTSEKLNSKYSEQRTGGLVGIIFLCLVGIIT